MIRVTDLDKKEYLLPNGEKAFFSVTTENGKANVNVMVAYKNAFGMGEHFDTAFYKGKSVSHLVREKFCNQGADTYLSIPFFYTDSGLGLYVDCDACFTVSFMDSISFSVEENTKIDVFTGNVKDIVSSFNKLMGKIPLIPQKYLGPWISANHWNTEEKAINAVESAKKYGFPVSVIVLEAWSDEATFYIFNGAEYTLKESGEAYRYDDFDFSNSKYWHNPKKMIERFKEDGISLMLWQIPVYKEIPMDEPQNLQNELDKKLAIEKKLCVFNADGTPYRIPEGNWFGGSVIPDFSNEETRKDWFEKRRYLLDIGVAGFKTDGGEFIYKDDLSFADGKTGKEKKNTYCQDYIDAYYNFVGEDRLLFSRAGSKHIAQTPAVWAGDHQSTNDELKNVYNAAISAACSGIVYWSFDIGGFAGELPSLDLYRRATEFAVFTPIMQWHSEPDGGQFKELAPGAEGNNERSPWNMAAAYNEPAFIDEMLYWHKVREKLVPYIHSELTKCTEKGLPLMQPLFWSEPEKGLEWYDEYFFGEKLLVAPLLGENEQNRKVYLPKGKWEGYFSKTIYEGGRVIDSVQEKYPVYRKL